MKQDFFTNICLRLLGVSLLILGTLFFCVNTRAAASLVPIEADDFGFLTVYSSSTVTVADDAATVLYIVDGATVVTTTLSINGQVDLYLTPGEYQLSQQPSDGYTPVFFVDSEDPETPQCDTSGRILVPAEQGGVRLVCNILQSIYVPTEEEVPPFVPTTSTLHINQLVINDNGDNKTVIDFPFDVAIDGVTTTYPGASTTTIVNLSATSTYSVDLAVPGSYARTLSGDCSGTSSEVGTLVTCTIALDDQELFLTDVRAEAVDTTSVKVMWTTSHAATSRVIYDVVNHDATTTPPLYGYAFTSNEQGEFVTNHEVIIAGLAPDTLYYFRAVSHGSPEVVSNEVSVKTIAATGGGQNFSTGAGGGGVVAPPPTAPTPAPAPVPSAPQAVLGEKIEVTAPLPSPTPQAVLGFQTLPVTGGRAPSRLPDVAVDCMLLGGLLVLRTRLLAE